jgi:hypothetical protein
VVGVDEAEREEHDPRSDLVEQPADGPGQGGVERAGPAGLLVGPTGQGLVPAVEEAEPSLLGAQNAEGVPILGSPGFGRMVRIDESGQLVPGGVGGDTRAGPPRAHRGHHRAGVVLQPGGAAQYRVVEVG